MTPLDNLFTTGKIKSLMLELAIANLGPLPWFEGLRYIEFEYKFQTYVIYRLNDLFSVASLAKLLIMFRYFVYLSRFTTGRAQRVCQMNGIRADLLFATKSIMKDHPFTIVGISSLLIAAIGSYCLMIFERTMSMR